MNMSKVIQAFRLPITGIIFIWYLNFVHEHEENELRRDSIVLFPALAIDNVLASEVSAPETFVHWYIH